MTIWFTSDQHFGHSNIIKYTNRSFKTVLDMDELMITRWNQKVQSGDVVYHLGDFTLKGYTEFKDYISRLNGVILFVPGGHDWKWMNDYEEIDGVDILPSLYIAENILPKQGKYSVPITMCHYPMLSWERSHYGAPHIHGHTHGTIGTISRSYDRKFPPGQKAGIRVDVGVDNWDFYPINVDKILEIINDEESTAPTTSV